MSCLAPAPLADIATKADIGDLAARIDALAAQRETDRTELAAQREADRIVTKADMRDLAARIDALAAQRETDRIEAAAQREADVRTSRHRHYWAVGIMTTLFGANMAVVLGSLLNAL